MLHAGALSPAPDGILALSGPGIAHTAERRQRQYRNEPKANE